MPIEISIGLKHKNLTGGGQSKFQIDENTASVVIETGFLSKFR